jgi:hypothetical protein
MSNLTNLGETMEWIRSWEEASPSRSYRWLSWAATEQRELLELCKRDRRFPGNATEEEYEACVAAIEDAAMKMKVVRDNWEREYDRRGELDRHMQKEAMAMAGRRFPVYR